VILKQLHDELDAAVFDAYGWPADLTDEQLLERLVKLNAERAEEERRGLIRWLRLEFQNPAGTHDATQSDLDVGTDDEAVAPTSLPGWPKKLSEQVPALRDLVGKGGAWTAAQAAAAFKGATPEDVEEVLDSLAALGLLVTWVDSDVRQWRASVRAAA
jgi:hypothetical protein